MGAIDWSADPGAGQSPRAPSLDALLAARAAAQDTSQPPGLDAMLAARAAGKPVPQPARRGIDFSQLKETAAPALPPVSGTGIDFSQLNENPRPAGAIDWDAVYQAGGSQPFVPRPGAVIDRAPPDRAPAPPSPS